MSAKDDESGVLCSHRYIGTQQPHMSGTWTIAVFQKRVPLQKKTESYRMRLARRSTVRQLVLCASYEDRAAALGVLRL